MKFRYIISEKWASEDIMLIIRAVEFAANRLDLGAGTTTIKLINTKEEMLEGTADRIKSKRYEIRLNKYKLIEQSDILVALFHEMTHVKQYDQNGFRFYNKKAIFDGKEYSTDEYWFSPWEMEARAMERPLLYAFKEQD